MRGSLVHEVELLPERICVFNGRASQWTRGLSYSLVRDVFSFRFGIQESDPTAIARGKFERGITEFFGGGEEARMRAQIGLENYSAAEGNLQLAVTMTGSAGHFALSMIYCYLAESFWGQGKR